MDETPQQRTGTEAPLAEHLAELEHILTRMEGVVRSVRTEAIVAFSGPSAVPASVAIQQTVTDESLAARARRTLSRRRWRDRCLAAPELLGEPTWDILLELFIKHVEDDQISVSSAAYASYVPLTTALRYITQLEARGWVVKAECTHDKRRSYLQLTPHGLSLMRNALAER
jgi:DNA-binding MarR family transcriptional regulator